MRRCMLLPIEDSVNGAVAFKVFEQVEQYLQESEWCYYRPNSEIINILANYKKNLSSHLDNKEVLKIIAERTKTGSLIRTKIINQVNGAEIQLTVLGDNGEDIYFKESTTIKGDDAALMAQTIKNWLDIYEKTIPYDGRVIGVLGDQFTVDIGKTYGVSVDHDVIISRPEGGARHPLLKEVVEWKTQKVGEGTIFHIAESQSQGKMQEYEQKRRLKIEDWVILKKNQKQKIKQDEPIEDPEGQDFGKVGTFGLFFNIGNGSATLITPSSTKKIGGTLLGIDLEAEVWATRNFWAGMDVSRKLGTFKKKEGLLQNESNSVTIGTYKAMVGYRYLPLGFFYGPRVDGYIGYANYNYGLDTQASDGFTEASFKGLMLGVGGSIPLFKVVRIMLDIDFMVKPKYAEEVALYGEADSTSNYHLEGGVQYLYSPAMSLDASLGFSNSKAKFQDSTNKLTFKETSLKLGATFTF